MGIYAFSAADAGTDRLPAMLIHMDPIYLDHNATTPLLPEVYQAMEPLLTSKFGNPASAHAFGRRARQALEDAREQIAMILGSRPEEILFTSGATEANNLALQGLTESEPGHIIVSPIEHPSVAEPIRHLPGFDVDSVPVDREGIVDLDAFRALIRPDTRLAAVMLANHETGALQPIRRLVDALADRAYFHCDATQAVGRIPVRWDELGVTTLSASAHKFHGPKGIGLLMVRQGTRLKARMWGGHQQGGKRPGTEPVALVVGMAKALELWHTHHETRMAHVRRLRANFLDELDRLCAPMVVNGPREHGMPHTINVSFPGCPSDSLLMNLDLSGVACSTGSACSSGSLLPSPVLQAMNIPSEILRSAMRFSFSFLTTDEEVRQAVERIGSCVSRLRDSAHEP